MSTASSQAEIARLEEIRLVATEDRIDADLRSGLHRDTIGELVGIASEYPLRERPVSLLMTALYRSGRQADSLRAFQVYSRTIGEEPGIEPSPELHRLEEQVLLADPRLAPMSIHPVTWSLMGVLPTLRFSLAGLMNPKYSPCGRSSSISRTCARMTPAMWTTSLKMPWRQVVPSKPTVVWQTESAWSLTGPFASARNQGPDLVS
jgi:hypothetical protein